jgi:hypothetical protein
MSVRRQAGVERGARWGVLADDDNDYVIHAKPARPKYLKLARPNRGDHP